MKLRTQTAWATALGLILGASCGETPSFNQKEESMLKKGAGGEVDELPSADATSPNGDRITIGPGGETIVTHPDGSQTITTPDGETTVIGPNGETIVNDTSRPGGDSTVGDRDESEEGGGSGGAGSGGGGQGKHPKPGDEPLPGDGPVPPKTLSREQSFPAAMLMGADATQDLLEAHLSTTLGMQRLYTDKLVTRQQLIRPEMADLFDQGHPGADEVERFDQIANRTLDILVVIDDSQSMRQEQDNLASKLAPLLQYVSSADWRIGVVLTDPSRACLRGLINKGDANAAQAFARAVSAGTNGGDANNERGVLTAVRALAGQCQNNANWLRPDSTLAVLVVTDEDNCSDGTACPGKPYEKGDYLLDYIKQIREPGANARIYGIFWHPEQSERQCRSAFNRAHIWSKLVTATMGTWGSICDDDYTPTLQAMSRDLKATLNTKFTLKFNPEPGSVRVFVDFDEVTTGVQVTGKVVHLSPPPPEGALITVSYRHGAAPIKSTFPLRFKPLDGTLEVTVNGTVVPSDAYTFDPQALAITFDATPMDRAKIAISYTRDMPLPAQFNLGDVISAGTLEVEIDGVPTTDYTVLEPVGSVTFTTAPAEGVMLRFIYTAVGAPVLRYQLQPAYDPPKDLVAFDAQTAAAIRFTYKAGVIEFHKDDYLEGRQVTVRYDNLARQRFTITLGNEPVPSTVSAEGGSILCAGAPYITVTGRDVNVANCNFADDVDLVTIHYKYVGERYQEFVFDAPDLPAPGDWQEWKVYVDDDERDDWTRDGNVIKFTEALPADGTVKVVLTQEVK